MTKNTKVISAFPGTGKSYLFNNPDFTKNRIVLDSDSTKFSKLEDGTNNPDFPNNYMTHIKENIGKADFIFVSSHKSVRDALDESNIAHVLIFPKKELKEEYIQRYKDRGNTEAFINFISNSWDLFIDDMVNAESVKQNSSCFDKIQLPTGWYISNILCDNTKK